LKKSSLFDYFDKRKEEIVNLMLLEVYNFDEAVEQFLNFYITFADLFTL
jgi:hypothetical protein